MTDKQPAAWMYERDSLLPVHLCKDRLPEVSRKVYQTETPLYTRPATAQGDVEAVALAQYHEASGERELEWYRGGSGHLTQADMDAGWTETLLVPAAATTERDRALREALDAAWKFATQMRNAAKLVGPYPEDQKKNAIWARSLYHQGKELHALLKPTRAILASTGDAA